MKPVCAALLSILLAAFAPEQGQNNLVCRTVDAGKTETLELTTRFTRINDLFLVVGDVHLDGKFEGQDIHRTFSASDFQMNQQIDQDGLRRLSFHSRNGVNDRLKWFIRDDAGSDAFSFDLPAKLGMTKASGKFQGELKGQAVDSVAPARDAECSSTPAEKK